MKIKIEIIQEKVANGPLTNLPFATDKVTKIDNLLDLSNEYGVRPIVNFVNVQVVKESIHDVKLRDMLKTNINFVDGVGVFWRVLSLSINNLKMQTGPEIMALVSVYARQKNAKLCFIGNTEIAKHYADVNDLYNNDCLYFEPNFSSFAEDLITTDLIMRINAHKPDLIIISLGGGKQTVFANLIYNELGYSPHLILNVGAAISKFGEKTSRLSDVMKYLGVQSLLRLLYEPQKAYRRILLEDIPWMYNLGVELIKHAYKKYLSR